MPPINSPNPSSQVSPKHSQPSKEFQIASIPALIPPPPHPTTLFPSISPSSSHLSHLSDRSTQRDPNDPLNQRRKISPSDTQTNKQTHTHNRIIPSVIIPYHTPPRPTPSRPTKLTPSKSRCQSSTTDPHVFQLQRRSNACKGSTPQPDDPTNQPDSPIRFDSSPYEEHDSSTAMLECDARYVILEPRFQDRDASTAMLKPRF